MSYTKTNWVNDNEPAINATNLNKIEQGIYDNDAHIGDITQLTTTANTDLVSAINENVDNIGDLTTLTTTAKADLVSAINELDSDKLETTGTAYNSSRIGGWEMESSTENNTDTWIPVFGRSKIQHTTISNLVSRGNDATTTTKGLMSASDKTKINNMIVRSFHYAFGQTTEAYINVTETFSLLFVYGLNGGSSNFFGTIFHTDSSEVTQITGSSPTFTFVNSTKLKVKNSSAWGQIIVLSNNPVSVTSS